MTDPYVCHIWIHIYHEYTPVMLAIATIHTDPIGVWDSPNAFPIVPGPVYLTEMLTEVAAPSAATFLVANSGHLWRKRMGRDGRDGQELANCGPPGPQNSHASVNGLLPQFRRSNCFDSNMISNKSRAPASLGLSENRRPMVRPHFRTIGLSGSLLKFP